MQVIGIWGLLQVLTRGKHHNNNLCCFSSSLFLLLFHGDLFDICSVPACFANWSFKEELVLWWEGRQTKSLVRCAESSESSMIRGRWKVWWVWHCVCIPDISALLPLFCWRCGIADCLYDVSPFIVTDWLRAVPMSSSQLYVILVTPKGHMWLGWIFHLLAKWKVIIEYLLGEVEEGNIWTLGEKGKRREMLSWFLWLARLGACEVQRCSSNQY